MPTIYVNSAHLVCLTAGKTSQFAYPYQGTWAGEGSPPQPVRTDNIDCTYIEFIGASEEYGTEKVCETPEEILQLIRNIS